MSLKRENNKLRYVWFSMLLLLASTLMWGCDQNPIAVEKEHHETVQSHTRIIPADVLRFEELAANPAINAEAKSINKQLESISRRVAQVLSDDEMRAYVYERALDRFDGETNVLWSQLNSPTNEAPVTLQRPENSPWSELVVEDSSLGENLSTTHRLNAAIERAGDLLGGPLHLYWVLADRFDGEEVPLVTFTPVGVDSDQIDYIEAFNADGKTYVVNEQTTRVRPVVVITSNERVSRDGLNVLDGDDFQMDAMSEPCEEEEQLDSSGCDDSGSGGSSGGSGAGDNYDNYPGHMALDWIKMYDPYEGWPNGGPEFHMTLTAYDAVQEEPVSMQGVRLWDKYDISRSDCDGRKIELNHVVKDWNEENYVTYSIQWVERDSDDWLYKYWIYDVPFKLPAWASASKAIVDHFIRVDSSDDVLEHAVTHYDDSPKYYGTGAPDFHLTLIPE